MITIFHISNQTPLLLTIFALKSGRPFDYLLICWMNYRVDPDQTPRFATSDLGLHSLLRSVCPNT